jgi:hypothetical protein
MAITANVLTSGAGTGLATASIAPGANRLVLAIVVGRFTTNPGANNVWAASGNGLTWERVLESGSYASSRKLGVFRAMGASPSSGAVTFSESWSGALTDGAAWAIVEFNGVDTSGSNGSGAIGSTPVSAVHPPGAPPLNLTITATPGAGDVSFAAVGHLDNTTDPATDALWVNLVDDVVGGESLLRIDWDEGQDLTPTFNWTDSPSNRSAAAIGFIIKAAPAAVGRSFGAVMG